MSNDIQVLLLGLGMRIPKDLIDELCKDSPFYSHCVSLIHNIAKEEGFIDGEPIEAPILSTLRKVFTIYIYHNNILKDRYYEMPDVYYFTLCTSSFHLGITCASRYLKNPKKDRKCFKFTDKDRPSNSYKKLSKKYNKGEEEILEFATSIYGAAINELRDLTYPSGINMYFILEAIFQLVVTLTLYKK
ncbi:MAG: hypothetical protein K6G26_01180 [Lachnospiraceae bacterium]|nr:hypothetical protein [Lachnospiraceae bacterium]